LKNKFNEDKEIFKIVLEKIKLSAKARLAAKLAKETILRKNVFAGGVLP
jgi:DNA gyrase/topoisomerase IV subunit B